MYSDLVSFLLTFLLTTKVGNCIVNHRERINLPKCEACERLVESFLKGIERTERDNHAGGNTAWEEAQLRTYANSEVRFVEIQERLCQDNRTTMDQCQTLAEELEEHLEQWWVRDRWEAPDLRHYLCVKKVKYCSPKLTSSLSTLPARQAPAPDGLKCPAGWQFRPPQSCEDVNECWSDPCGDDKYCMNTDGSYICRPCHQDCLQCYGPGPYECKVYKHFLDHFVGSFVAIYHLSMIGPTFIFAYVFIVLCANFMFKIPLMPSICLLCLVICLGAKLLLEEQQSDSSSSDG